MGENWWFMYSYYSGLNISEEKSGKTCEKMVLSVLSLKTGHGGIILNLKGKGWNYKLIWWLIFNDLDIVSIYNLMKAVLMSLSSRTSSPCINE